jgi:hypothetical protein
MELSQIETEKFKYEPEVLMDDIQFEELMNLLDQAEPSQEFLETDHPREASNTEE